MAATTSCSTTGLCVRAECQQLGIFCSLPRAFFSSAPAGSKSQVASAVPPPSPGCAASRSAEFLLTTRSLFVSPVTVVKKRGRVNVTSPAMASTAMLAGQSGKVFICCEKSCNSRSALAQRLSLGMRGLLTVLRPPVSHSESSARLAQPLPVLGVPIVMTRPRSLATSLAMDDFVAAQRVARPPMEKAITMTLPVPPACRDDVARHAMRAARAGPMCGLSTQSVS